MRLLTLTCVAWLAGCALLEVPAEPTSSNAASDALPPGELPGSSIYHLEVALTDHSGDAVPLSVFAGQPVLISMFYASCPSACPMLIGDIQALEAAMSEAERARTRVLLVSLDPEADTPRALSSVIAQHGIDAERWRLTSPEPRQVRDIAALLGISYQAIEGGEMHHSSIITLLDPAGTPVARVEGLRQSPEPIVAAMRAL